MKEVYSDITIKATPEKIWSILTDVDKYPDWNPTIRYIHGEIKEGSKVVLELDVPGQKPMVFKPKIKAFQPYKKFSWLGHILMPGIFDGEHIFEIVDNNDGTCKFIQRELYNGILIPIYAKTLDTNNRQGYINMNEKLKELCEK